MSSIIKVKNGKGEHWKAIYDLPKFVDGTRHRTSKTFPVGTPLKTVKEFAPNATLIFEGVVGDDIITSKKLIDSLNK